jgi:hypothetical protein
MGCANSKAGNDGPRLQSGGRGLGESSHLKGDSDVEAFRENLFSKVGELRSYAPNDVLIEEGKVCRVTPPPPFTVLSAQRASPRP